MEFISSLFNYIAYMAGAVFGQVLDPIVWFLGFLMDRFVSRFWAGLLALLAWKAFVVWAITSSDHFKLSGSAAHVMETVISAALAALIVAAITNRKRTAKNQAETVQ